MNKDHWDGLPQSSTLRINSFVCILKRVYFYFINFFNSLSIFQAISQVRMQSIAQLSQALATAQAAQTVQNENKVEPGVQEQRQYAILKVTVSSVLFS